MNITEKNMGMGYSPVILTKTGQVPTIPVYDHFLPTDIHYDGQLCVNIPDYKAWTKIGKQIFPIVISSFDLAQIIHNATLKPVLANADEFGIWDSVTHLLRKVTWLNIINGLTSFFNSVYQTIITDIVNLPTATLNTSLVLHPNGAGGLVWGLCGSGTGIFIPEVFTATAGQTSFPTSMAASIYCEVYEMGIRVFRDPALTWDIVGGVVTFVYGRPVGTQIAISRMEILEPEVFYATAGQTTFTPAGFVPTIYSKVYENGAQQFRDPLLTWDIVAGSVEFVYGRPDTTQIAVAAW
jgi:hypothetical protein